jgi:hypothetical protein
MALLAIAALTAIGGVVGFRSVNAAQVVAAKSQPLADLKSLAPFLGPLPDEASLAGVVPGTMVVDRDPFEGSAADPRAMSGAGALVGPKAAGRQQWVVSSILFEDSRRSAIVNNKWVTVGDELGGGARLSAIERKHVVVTDAQGNRHVVPIQDGEQ